MNLLRDKQLLFDRWALVYDWLFPSIFYQAVHQRLLTYVELPDAARILDIGCGTGRLLNRLAAQQEDIQGFGLDFSAEMVRQARQSNQHRPRLIFLEGKSAPLRFVDEFFDAVFCTFSLMHYPQADAVFAEIWRVLKPGGRFYWVDPLVQRVGGDRRWVPISPGGIQLYPLPAREQMGGRAGFIHPQHHSLLSVAWLTMYEKPALVENP
jgi:ubiquinone/menaquinone biosynthesis C-methylase UbiE